jgi:hypothetical protein
MIYRFHPDVAGDVFAEDERSDLEAWKGQRYPAYDIPEIACDIFKKITIRSLQNARGPLAELVPLANPDTGRALELTHCGRAETRSAGCPGGRSQVTEIVDITWRPSSGSRLKKDTHAASRVVSPPFQGWGGNSGRETYMPCRECNDERSTTRSERYPVSAASSYVQPALRA